MNDLIELPSWLSWLIVGVGIVLMAIGFAVGRATARARCICRRFDEEPVYVTTGVNRTEPAPRGRRHDPDNHSQTRRLRRVLPADWRDR